MKPIVFNTELTNKNIISLMEEIYSSISEKSIIYFSGTGTNIIGGSMLVNFINNLKNNGYLEHCTMVAFDKLYQSAFTIFFKCGLHKKVLKTAIGLIELPQDIIGIEEQFEENKFISEIAEKDNNNFMRWLEPVSFTEEEVEKISLGEQLMLDNGKLQDIHKLYGELLIEPII